MSISVTAVGRPSKEALTAMIAAKLNLPAPAVSGGGSVWSHFLDAVYGALFSGTPAGLDTYRKADRLLSQLGLIYDPWWDTSESRATGGGTVTTRAFSRILAAITGRPRCFIVNWWDLTDQTTLKFFTQADLNPFAEAGPGSMVLIADQPNGQFIRVYAWAEVVEMTPGWRHTPWFATMGPRNAFESPVGVNVDGLRRGPLRLTEISREDFDAVVGEGSPSRRSARPPVPREGARRTAERIDRLYPAETVPIGGVRIPAADFSPPTITPLHGGAYRNEDYDLRPTLAVAAESPSERGARMDESLNRITEARAITLARRALMADGWALRRDCQQDGVGYDLLFERDDRRLKVEVKGIQGPRLVFNVTPKEWWRATTDPEWIVVAITSVMSPTAPKVHVVPRGHVTAARRLPLGYRVWIA